MHNRLHSLLPLSVSVDYVFLYRYIYAEQAQKRVQIMKTRLLIVLLILVMPNLVNAKTHKKVQAAMDYTVPENTCKKPTKFASTKTTGTAPAQSSSGTDVFSGGGTVDNSDTDSYTIRRLEKKEKKWRKCVDKYKAGLLKDMDTLKASAQYGLTQAQADKIIANMRGLQDVYMTPDGVLDTAMPAATSTPAAAPKAPVATKEN
jgi:hypothetical protein